MRAKVFISTALAVCALGVTAASAFATTVSPTGNFTASLTSASADFNVNGNVVSCTDSTLTGSVNAAGAGTISGPGSSTAFTGCSTLLGGSSLPTTVSVSLPWTAQVDYNGGSPTITISDVDATISIAGGFCVLEATGSVTGLYDNSTGDLTLTAAPGLTSSYVSGFCPSNATGSATFSAIYNILNDATGNPFTVSA